jgi:AcrR family transcriptional regulator
MVNRIDESARRRLLAEAVWRIVTRDGLAAASVRTVAKESGLSTGSVRHFFGTQHELIVFAMEELIATVGERVGRAAAIEDPEARVLAVLSELMPLTPATHDEAFAHLQFVLQARIDPRLAPIAAESFDAIHGLCEQVVRWLVDLDELPADTDVPGLAAALRALVDGLTFELLLAPHLVSPDDALEVLRGQLRHAAVRHDGELPR